MDADEREKLLGDPQNLNPYTYARNNPIVNVDPDGENWWAVLEAIAIILTPDTAYAPDADLDNQIASGNAPFKEKPNILGKILFGAAGASQIRKGTQLLESGIEAATKVGGEHALKEGIKATATINKGLVIRASGITDVVRATVENDPKVKTYDILKNGIIKPVKQAVNQWILGKGTQKNSDRKKEKEGQKRRK